MNCPRCECEHIRKSRSKDSAWQRLFLKKTMRCYRCCYVFTVPVWANPNPVTRIDHGDLLNRETATR